MEEVLNGYVTNPNPIPTLTPNPNRNPNSNPYRISKIIQKSIGRFAGWKIVLTHSRFNEPWGLVLVRAFPWISGRFLKTFLRACERIIRHCIVLIVFQVLIKNYINFVFFS
jgi:hypothetical protein